MTMKISKLLLNLLDLEAPSILKMFESRNTSKEAYLGKSPAMACIFCSDSCNREGDQGRWNVAMRTMSCRLIKEPFAPKR